MLKPLIGGALGALALAGSAEAATVELRDVAARVTVIPEDRSDIAVTMVRTNPKLPLQVRQEAGGDIRIDGDVGQNWMRMWLGGRIASCPSDGDRPSIKVLGVGTFDYDELPQIVIRTPRETHVHTRGVVLGAIGRADDVDLLIAGCDRWTVANVRDELKVHYVGSGRVRAGSAGRMTVKIVGSGDFSANQVANGLTVEIAGSGEVSAASVSGPVKLEVAGDGDVNIGGGHASELTVKIAGSGDVKYNGVADSLTASIAGSGDVYAAKVTGPVSKSIAGSGRIEVGP
ncbi:MAG: DUF2807 domain-containing protein [Caulobacteraceae bacterium]|nr:DUF2807 domain-containing protein [Caulobacteraceae bacterium]